MNTLPLQSGFTGRWSQSGMINRFASRAAISFALFPLVQACASSANAPSAAGTVKIVHVAAQTSPCTGVAPMTCLQVRSNPQQPWGLFYQSIEGFDHRPGVEYTLRIIETPVANPPADASSVRWTLDRIIEQAPARDPQ